MLRRLRVEFVAAWYDCWIGAYYDRKGRWLYLMVPFVGVRIMMSPRAQFPEGFMEADDGK